MELTQLRYFLAVARLEHMTRAAAQLHIAQPALTKSIRKLEAELGAALVERKGRNIALTVAGHALAEMLEEPMAQLDAIPGELASLARAEDATIRLKVLAATSFVTDCVIRYRAAHPGLQFDLLLVDDAAGADVVVDTCGVEGAPPSGRAFAERVLLAVPRESPLAGCGSVALAQAREETFITLAGNRKFADLCGGWCRQAGFTPRRIYESDGPATIRNLIALGCGVGLWPEHTWGAPGEGVVLVPITDPRCARRMVVRRAETPRALRPAVQDFADTLTAGFAGLLGEPAPRGKNAQDG